MAEPRGPRLQTVCFILLAPLFAHVACGLIGSKLEDTPWAGAGNLKDRSLVVTVSRVVDGDTVEITHAVDGLTEVRLIGIDTSKQSIRALACSPMARRPPASPCLLRREMGVHYACNIEQSVRARMEERLLSLRR
jgi:endonuclease YncB( thermonuclease family)